MSSTATLSRPAAVEYLRQGGLTDEDARQLLGTVPVAARWNTGLGRTEYYYSTDLYKALVNSEYAK